MVLCIVHDQDGRRNMPAGSNAPVAVHAGDLLTRLLAHNVAEHIQHRHLGLLSWLVLHVISSFLALWYT